MYRLRVSLSPCVDAQPSHAATWSGFFIFKRKMRSDGRGPTGVVVTRPVLAETLRAVRTPSWDIVKVTNV